LQLTSPFERELFFRSFIRGTRVPESVARQFAESVVEVVYPAGSVIYSQGEPSQHVTYVIRGEVELRAQGEQPWRFGSRSAIGGLDAFQEHPYSRTAVALADTLVLRIRYEDWMELLEDNFDFAKSAVHFFYRGLEGLSAEVAPEEVYPPLGEERLSSLRTAHTLGLVERLQVLRAAEPFRRIRMQVLVRLAEASSERHLEAGEVLAEPGQTAGMIYLVARGAVEAARSKPPAVFSHLAGNTVHTYPAFGDEEASYRTRALEQTLLLALRKEDLFDVMEDHADVTRVLLAFGAAERQRLMRIKANRAAEQAQRSAA
jgi:CRP-like cAMP-binding protein